MNQRGFTMVELAIVVSIAAILLPLVYSFAWHLESQRALVQWNLEVADATRSLNEELRLDRRAGGLVAGPALRFDRPTCPAEYLLVDQTLVRRADAACAGDRGLARNVGSFERVDGGVELIFVRALRPEQVHRTTIFLPLEAP